MEGREKKLSAKLKFSDTVLSTKMSLWGKWWYLAFYVSGVVERLQEHGRVSVPALVPDSTFEVKVYRSLSYSYPGKERDLDEFVYPMMYLELTPSVN